MNAGPHPRVPPLRNAERGPGGEVPSNAERGPGGEVPSNAERGPGGEVPVLETLEFPAALARVAAHAVGPLGAARVMARRPAADPAAIRDSLAQVAELAAILGGLDPHERAGDAAVTVRNGRYVIPVRTTSRARLGGIVHDESATRATVFVEPPEVIELGNELRSREAAEQREVLRVLRALTDLLRPHRAAIAAAWEMSIAFDDLCARARYAVVVNGFTPVIGEGPLVIRGGRHPLLFAGATVVVPVVLYLAPAESPLPVP